MWTTGSHKLLRIHIVATLGTFRHFTAPYEHMSGHIENYDDGKLRDLALYRVQTFFDVSNE